jgi:hypothetical protein
MRGLQLVIGARLREVGISRGVALGGAVTPSVEGLGATAAQAHAPVEVAAHPAWDLEAEDSAGEDLAVGVGGADKK